MNTQIQETPASDEHRESKPRIAFISGHIDLPQETFLLHYKGRLDAAIAAGDSFLVSNAGGADS